MEKKSKFSENRGFLYKIISDTFLSDIIEDGDNLSDSINLSLIQSLLPLVKNFDLVIKFYESNYDFTNDELIELLEYLRYMGSKRIFEILVVIKCRDPHNTFGTRSKINKYLLTDYDNISEKILNFSENRGYLEKNTKYQINNILLRTSIYYNLIDIVKYLIDTHKIDLQICKDEIDNAMIFASIWGHVQIVELLLENGACIYAYRNYALQCASKNGHISVVKLLLDRGANISAFSGLYPLLLASYNGHIGMVEFLLNSGADIHARNDEALKWASEKGHTHLVALLLERGSDIHADSDIALRYASENGHISVVLLLLDNGANINACNNYALRMASQKGHKDVVTILLERGNYVYYDYSCALESASANGHISVVALLLERGANIHSDDDSPLRLASYNGHIKMVAFLLERGANIHAKDDYALRWADINDHKEIVKFLLQRGADKNQIKWKCIIL